MKIKKYLINGIILLLLIIMGAVGVLYFVLETHTKKQQNDESTVSLVETGQETQTDEITDVGDEGTENVPEEKFLDIFVSFSTQSGNERVKLFASDDLCYAFVPAFCSLDSFFSWATNFLAAVERLSYSERSNVTFEESYLILLMQDTYDVAFKTKNDEDLPDGSENGSSHIATLVSM